jgi:pyruvate,water dikinase
MVTAMSTPRRVTPGSSPADIDAPGNPGGGVVDKISYLCSKWLWPASHLRDKYRAFRQLLADDMEALEILAELDNHLLGHQPADPWRIALRCHQLGEVIERMALQLEAMNPFAYRELSAALAAALRQVQALLPVRESNDLPPYILSLDEAADHPGLTGGKATNLSHARRAGVVTPEGFVITASCFHRFIADNRLAEPFVRCLEQADSQDHQAIVRIAGELQELIIGSEVPTELARLIEREVADRFGDRLLAVRSSALAEDGKVSFAGQYASELQVEPTEAVQAYRRVLAGKYCPRAIGYRIRHGLSDSETAMAVLVLPMYQPDYSGVVYTRDPSRPWEDILSVYVVEGLGQGLVDGSQTATCYNLSRTDDDTKPLPEPTSLTKEQLQILKRWALQLEEYFGCPQDVEWLLADGRLLVVQSRPLPAAREADSHSAADSDLLDLSTVLGDGLHSASPGIGSGEVFIAPNGKSFRDIPKGAIVVTPTLRPALSQFLDRVNGVVATSGSRASHFASVARERSIPVVVGENVELTTGQEVTVDGYHGRIFAGISRRQTVRHKKHRDFPREKFAELAAATCHLNLLDPEAPDFSPQGCQSLHDFIRYCHEQGVREMFSLVGRKGRGMSQGRRLQTELPLTMYLLDLDAPRMSSKKPLTVAEITSLPMRACWTGLSDPRVPWGDGQRHLDWQEFDQLSGGIFSLNSRLLASFAVTSSDYLHLNIRFGYHFSVVDALCGENSGANYLNFRFKGGGAAAEQQAYRLLFIEKVLTEFGFDIKVRGDMLDGSLPRVSAGETALGLTRLGRLLAYTRMMDMRLQSAHAAATEAAKFIDWAA